MSVESVVVVVPEAERSSRSCELKPPLQEALSVRVHGRAVPGNAERKVVFEE
jgi:hypothetical protein